MTTIKSYTDISQSKKLAEILPLDSADMYYFLDPTPAGNIYHLVVQRVDIGTKNFPKYDEGDIPCWNLAALLEVLPKNVKSPFGEVNPFVGQVNTKDYRCVYLDGDWDSNIQTFAKNPIDACYKMILKLHEQNLL